VNIEAAEKKLTQRRNGEKLLEEKYAKSVIYSVLSILLVNYSTVVNIDKEDRIWEYEFQFAVLRFYWILLIVDVNLSLLA
jgi:hypothetical protein